MAHKIVMLGGYRAGKSSILSSILYSVTKINKGLFSIIDKTDYTAAEGAPVSLNDKRIEISQYIKKRNKVHGINDLFMVDMTPTNWKSTYTLCTRIDGTANVDFEFVDVPGEWMEQNHEHFNDLKDIVKTCDVFIIAIDTPYMMQDDSDVNECYNRIPEITKALDDIADDIVDPDCQKKMIIFCPVKCEKWVRDHMTENNRVGNEADAVTQAVKNSYRELINKFVNNRGISMWVMPIQTVGAIEFAEMKDAYRYYETKEDKEGIQCSYDELTGIVRLKDGNVISYAIEDQIEEDSTAIRGGMEIPWAWYKKNELSQFEPKDCEQPAFHILRFLVRKELAVTKNIKRQIDNSPWYIRIISWFKDPPYGKYIEQYRKVISELNIRESGNGFLEVREKVE